MTSSQPASSEASGPAKPSGAGEVVVGSRATLRRSLGLNVAIAVVVGNVIGSGIFLKPGTIALHGGQFGLIIGVWVFGGLLCVLGALCFAELATMWPQAGGLYVYLREAYGRPVGFLFGWSEFLFGKPASIGALAVAFVDKLPLPASLGYLAPLLAVMLIAAMAVVNVLGVVWGGRVQLITTWIKAGGVALIAMLPWLFLLWTGDGTTVSLSNYSTTIVPGDPSLAGRVGLILLAVMWAYNGWHGVTPLAEEIEQPQRNIPRALFTGIAILTALYLGANFAYHAVLPMAEMAGATEQASELMMARLWGNFGVGMISAIIMCSTFGAINTNLLQAPRVTFAMGRDGAFFRPLGHVHPEFRTPAAAILTTGAMAVALVLAAAAAQWSAREHQWASQWIPAPAIPGTLPARPQTLVPLLAWSLRHSSLFELLTNFVVFSASIFYVAAVAAVLVMRFRSPELNRPYRTWGYPWVPLAFIAVYVWFLSRILVESPLEALTGLALVGLGLPAYYLHRAWDLRKRSA